MKRFKVKYDPQEEVGLRAKRDPKKKLEVVSIEAYDLDTALPLRTHVEAIFRLVSPLDNLENYTLAVGENQNLQYVAPDEPLGPQLGRLPNNTIIYFKLVPRLRAQYFIEALSSDVATVKELLFSLRYTLKDGEFAEEFIDQQGLSQLMDVIAKSTGNIQAYALAALRAAMGYESGLNFFLNAPPMVEKLFFLIDASTLAASARHALELLFVLTSYNGWVLVNKSAKFSAKSRGIKPFSNLVALLKSGDVDTSVNTLTLLNSLIDNAPSKLKADKLINKLRDLNIEDVIHGVSNSTAEWKAQLAIFEANLHASAKTDKKPMPRNTANVNQMIDSLKAYEEQQPMLKVLYAELHHYQSLIATAIQHGAFLNPNVPNDRFDPKRDALATPVIGPLGPIRRSVGKGIGARMEAGPSGIRGSVTLRKKDSVAAILGAPLEHGDRDSFRMSQLIKPGTVDSGSRASMSLDAPPEGVPPPPPKSVAAEQLGASEKENAANAASAASVLGLPPPDGAAPPPPPEEFPVPSQVAKAPPAPKMKGAPKGPPPPPGGEETGATGGPPPPPPALGKGPPPPPPPGKGKGPGLPGGVQPTKPMIKPAAKMKPLHWVRILVPPTNAPNRRMTIWDTIQEIDFDHEDFENHFSAKQKEGGEGDNDKLNAALAGKGAIRVLNVKRSNAIAVMCSKLPETEQLIRAIRELDANILEKHLIRSLAVNMATAEELAQIREMLHPDIVLDKPEQFCLLLAEIPDLRERLKCWEYMLTLDERLVDIGPPIISVQRACREIAKSPSLKVVLGAVLALGNYMNGGHVKRGQADGFQIDALSKVLEIKDNQNKQTLVEYLIGLMKDLYPEILRFPDELPTAAAACKVNMKEVAAELRKLLIETKDVKAAAAQIIQNTDQQDPFIQIIPPFIEEAISKLANIRNDLLIAEKVYEELLKYFSCSIESSEEFFGYFTSFAQAFRNVLSKLEQKKGRGAKGKRLGAAGEGSDDPMASIIANIRAGKARKEQQN